MPRAWDQSTFVFLSSRSGESLGRVERRMLASIAALVERGATVLVICGPRSPLAEAAAALGATIAPYRLEIGRYLRVASRLRKYLSRYQPVCAHSTGLRADLLVRWAARDLPVAVVNSLPCGAWPRGGPLQRWLDRRTMWRCAHVLVDCEQLAAELREHTDGTSDRIVYDPPSVNVPRVIVEAAEGISADSAVARRDRPLVGFASRLEKSRGAEHLVAAAVLLRERGVEVDVVIAGRGPSLDPVKRAAAADSGGVRVLGEVPSLPAVLAAFDVCVFPSVDGGAPTALLEAAVLGRPIVASSIPGIEGLFADGAEISLVPPADPAALAEAIAGTLADPPAARSMGERARQRALDEYSSADAVERHLRMYRGFLAR